MDEERNAFDAFMDQTCKSYLHIIICNFLKTCKSFRSKASRFSFLKRKIFLKIPVLMKINPRQIISSFAKINPREIVRGWHSRKLIHVR